MKKLIEQLQPQDTELQETFREVYVPTQPLSFEEALLYARRRQTARRRALVAVNVAGLVLLSSLYFYWARPTMANKSPMLQPIPSSEIAEKNPTKKNDIGAPTQPSSTQRSSSNSTTQKSTSGPSSKPSKKPTSLPGSLPVERP